MKAVLAVTTLSLRAQRARLLPRLLLLAAPFAGVGAALAANGEQDEGVRGLADALLLLLPGITLVSAALGSAVLRGERGEDSLRSVLLAPISRWKILLGLMLGAQAWALMVATLSCGSAVLAMLLQRTFGDIAPGGMFITASATVNHQATQLAPLCLGIVPVAVLAGVFGATLVEDALVAFLVAGAVLLLPALWTHENGLTFAPYALVDHALLTLRDLGEGRTEHEAQVDCLDYTLRHLRVHASWGLTLFFAALARFNKPKRV